MAQTSVVWELRSMIDGEVTEDAIDTFYIRPEAEPLRQTTAMMINEMRSWNAYARKIGTCEHYCLVKRVEP